MEDDRVEVEFELVSDTRVDNVGREKEGIGRN